MPLLEVQDVTVRFGGVTAVNGARFTVEPTGEMVNATERAPDTRFLPLWLVGRQQTPCQGIRP